MTLNKNISIRIPSCKVRIIIFAAYNLLYVLYMMGYTSQLLYLGTMILFCLSNAAVILLKKQMPRVSTREFKLGIIYVGVFFLISAFIQVIHSDFQSYLVSGIIRITLPIINAFLFVNAVEERDRDSFFNILLLRFILHFILMNYKYINMESIMSISWEDSFSPMETSMAHDFIIMEMYYLYRGQNKKSLLCMAFCMLSMKRLSFIIAPVLILISRFVPKNVPVKKGFIYALKLAAILSPLILLSLYSDDFQFWFLRHFNTSLDQVLSGRIRIYSVLANNIPYYNGYGSINSFLDEFVFAKYGTKWNSILHNDFLRLYLETTIIGVIVFANNLVELGKKEYWHFLMVVYLVLVAVSSHILNYFSVWITFYMIIMSNSNAVMSLAETENKKRI